jgi:hypothetical protein
MAIDNQDHIFYTYKEKIEREEQFKDFFWGGILVLLNSYKKIYVTCCDVEGVKSKVLPTWHATLAVKHSQRMFQPGWYIKPSSRT